MVGTALDGSSEGCPVGVAVGVSFGRVDGDHDGAADGLTVGAALDGCSEGCPAGSLDGVNEIFVEKYFDLVGLLLGPHDGFPSGATLGRREGVRLGLLLGC